MKLERIPGTVEEFVEHLTFLVHLSNEMPILENEYQIVTGLFQVAIRFALDFSVEEWALYRTLAPSFAKLKVSFHLCTFKCQYQ